MNNNNTDADANRIPVFLATGMAAVITEDIVSVYDQINEYQYPDEYASEGIKIVHEAVTGCFPLYASNGETQVHIHFPVCNLEPKDPEHPTDNERFMFGALLQNRMADLKRYGHDEVGYQDIPDMLIEAYKYIDTYTSMLDKQFKGAKPVIHVMGGTTCSTTIRDQVDTLVMIAQEREVLEYDGLTDATRKEWLELERESAHARRMLMDAPDLAAFSELACLLLIRRLRQRGYEVNVMEDHLFNDHIARTRQFHVPVDPNGSADAEPQVTVLADPVIALNPPIVDSITESAIKRMVVESQRIEEAQHGEPAFVNA